MATGTVKWYDVDKAYGVLVPEQGDKDLVFRAEQFDGDPTTLETGEAVSYTLRDPRRGVQVDRVSREP